MISLVASSSMCERVRLEALVGFVILQNFVLFPLVACWAYNQQGGWLHELGFIDRAASIVVFHLGSLTGLIGSIVLGPRYRRFQTKQQVDMIKSGFGNKAIHSS